MCSSNNNESKFAFEYILFYFTLNFPFENVKTFYSVFLGSSLDKIKFLDLRPKIL